MKSRFCLFGIFFLLFSGFFTGSGYASDGLALRVAPVSPAFEHYRESLKRSDSILPQGGGAEKKPMGYIPSPVDLSHLRNADYSSYFSGGKSRAAHPEKYDLRDLSQVTPVKNQKPYGNCWAFSAIGSLESAYLKKTNTSLDLSEMHLAYYAYRDTVGFFSTRLPDDVMDSGGFDNIAVATMARRVGPVLESDAPHGVLPTGPYTNYPNRLHLQGAFFLSLQFKIGQPQPTNDMRKELITSYGAISVAFHASDEKNAYNPVTAAWCNKEKPFSTADHAVLAIGWDDNYPKENFKEGSRPAGNGAWLIKNSWGTDWGREGYFWLSYEDTSFGDGVVYIPEETSNFDKIYSYDDLGWCASAGNPDGKTDNMWMANVFTAGSSEDLKAVSFYTTDANAEYELSVYTGLTDENDPKSGTLAVTQKGKEVFAGYHTVRLNKSAVLASGAKFSIVVKMTTPNNTTPIAVEYPEQFYSDKAVSNKGESFFSPNGTVWEDGFAGKMNACIKAFTVSVTPQPVVPSEDITEKSVVSNKEGDWIRKSAQSDDSSPHNVSFSGRIDVTDGPITDVVVSTKGLTNVRGSIDGVPLTDAPAGRTYHTLTIEGEAADLSKAALLGLSSFTQGDERYKQTFASQVPFQAKSSGGGGGCSAAPGVLAIAALALFAAQRKGRDLE